MEAKWIRVADNPPPLCIYVLFAGMNCTQFVGYRYSASELDEKGRMNVHCPKSNHPRWVTHWMPLPVHPKEES